MSDIGYLPLLTFTPIDLSQMERMEAIRSASGNTLYFYSFASLFVWQKHEGYSVCMAQDAFLVKHGVRGDNVYLFPCGSDSGKDLAFRADAEAGKFSAVKIDGTEVAAGNYTVGEDGIVTLKNAYLKTLAVGEHALTLVFTDGEASAKFTVLAANGQSVVSPQTGDNSPIGLWIVLMTGSAVGATSLFLTGNRKRFFVK